MIQCEQSANPNADSLNLSVTVPDALPKMARKSSPLLSCPDYNLFKKYSCPFFRLEHTNHGCDWGTNGSKILGCFTLLSLRIVLSCLLPISGVSTAYKCNLQTTHTLDPSTSISRSATAQQIKYLIIL